MEKKKEEVLTFGLLPEPNKRGAAFFVSAIMNAFIIVLFVVVSLAHFRQARKRHVEAIALTFPTEMPKQPPPPKIPPVKVVAPPPVEIAKLEPPKIKPPVAAEIEPPKPVVKLQPMPMPIVPPAPPKAIAPPPQPKVGLFASPAPTVVANNNSAPTPKMGGFGDPMGAKANANARDSKVQVATLGTFGGAPGTTDVGAGAARRGAVGGTTFGSGVANGVPGGKDRGTVASAGFSNGVVGGTGKPGGTGVVKAGGFGTAVATGTAPPPQQPKNDNQPVTVTYSAKPVYTQEARAAHVEGEVILRVRFTANGQVEVLSVVQPLGHGLDESAENAVKQYRFKPATQNGQAVDQTTTVHVRFQLA
jgi:TonB family protein